MLISLQNQIIRYLWINKSQAILAYAKMCLGTFFGHIMLCEILHFFRYIKKYTDTVTGEAPAIRHPLVAAASGCYRSLRGSGCPLAPDRQDSGRECNTLCGSRSAISSTLLPFAASLSAATSWQRSVFTWWDTNGFRHWFLLHSRVSKVVTVLLNYR